MKPLLAAILLVTTAAYADNSRYSTVISSNGPLPSIRILEGETAEIITCYRWDTVPPTLTYANVSKDGSPSIYGYPPGYGATIGVMPTGTTIAGPATLSPTSGNIILTVKITPSLYDVNRTLILPPGTNQVFITLESSTNLVQWADATNGVYGSPDIARFFRIRMQKL